MDLVRHLLLFAVVAFAIVVIGSFYGERDDAKALRSVPRRYAIFVLSCLGVAGVMLLCESLFTSVG